MMAPRYDATDGTGSSNRWLAELQSRPGRAASSNARQMASYNGRLPKSEATTGGYRSYNSLLVKLHTATPPERRAATVQYKTCIQRRGGLHPMMMTVDGEVQNHGI